MNSSTRTSKRMNSSTRRPAETSTHASIPGMLVVRPQTSTIGGGEAKRHQSVQIAVPQCIAEGLKRRAQRKRWRQLKPGIGLVTFLEPIIRDLRVYMVHMVKADIARKPLEQARQTKIGGSSERGRGKIQLASGIHCACSKRCWIENSQTPTIEAITMIGSWTAATRP